MSRILGTVKQISVIKPIFGIVVDDAGNEYMFIPSFVRELHGYYKIHVGQLLEFEPLDTPRGWRADRITVPSNTNGTVKHGESPSPR